MSTPSGRTRTSLRSPGFLGFLVTQFLGALNDNAFRFTLIFLIFATAPDQRAEGLWKGSAQVLFAVPFVAFAAWAGALADRLPKSAVIVWMKVLEIAVMALGLLAFSLGSLPLLLVVLFLMSGQSAFFGPAKYGFLAETIDEAELTRANGIVQMTTMVAIVAGQLLAGHLFTAFRGELASAALAFVAIATAGTLAALCVPRVAAARPGLRLPRNPVAELFATWRDVRRNVTLLYTILGIGHFFLLAALLQVTVPAYALRVLDMPEDLAGYLLAVSVLGIAAGSLLAGRWSEGKVELGLVPLGALLMSLGVLGLSAAPDLPVPLPGGVAALLEGTWAGRLLVAGQWPAFVLAFLVGVAGGLFIVPLWATLQIQAPTHEKGRFLAFGNAVSFVGVGLSALFFVVLDALEVPVRGQLLVLAVFTFVGTVISIRLLPYAFMRLLGWLLAHSLYRIRVLHGERLPAHGGALLLVNHVSWVDAIILLATTRRGMHFLMYRRYYEWWPTHWLFKLVGCIPVASGDPPDVVAAQLAEAGRHLDEGKLVVVFAEGAVTRLGHMLAFRSGYQRVLGGRDVPIIPVHLHGLWGSLFSHAGGRLLLKAPRAFPYPVTVSYGDALPSTVEPNDVRRAIRDLSVEAWDAHRTTRLPLHLTLLREDRRSFEDALHEHGRPALSRARLVARALLLGRHLERRIGASRRVGLMSPPGQQGAAAVLALLCRGRVPVMLDPASPPELLRRQLAAAAADTLLYVGGPPAGLSGDGLRVLHVDESVITHGAENAQIAVDVLLPWRLLARLFTRSEARSANGPAAVLFTSGVTGEPKGVVHSHFGVLSNVEGLQQVVSSGRRDGVLGILPFSHAAGFVLALWYPLLANLRVAWAGDAPDGRAVGKLAERARCTLLPASPPLLEQLVREARPDTLGGLRLVLCGLAALPPRLRDEFAATFGIVPLEMYTSTECGGVVALNTPDVRRPGVFQRGTRHGTVGHPLPGIAVDALDPQTGRVLPAGQPGLLLVRGPSVLRGTLEGGVPSAEERAHGVLTGDLGRIDEDGFISLAERAALPSPPRREPPPDARP